MDNQARSERIHYLETVMVGGPLKGRTVRFMRTNKQLWEDDGSSVLVFAEENGEMFMHEVYHEDMGDVNPEEIMQD